MRLLGQRSVCLKTYVSLRVLGQSPVELWNCGTVELWNIICIIRRGGLVFLRKKNMGLGTEIGDVNLPARTQAV